MQPPYRQQQYQQFPPHQQYEQYTKSRPGRLEASAASRKNFQVHVDFAHRSSYTNLSESIIYHRYRCTTQLAASSECGS